VTSENPNNENSPAQRTEGPAKKQNNAPPATIRPEPKIPDYCSDAAHKESKERRERLKARLEVIGLIVLIVYTIFTGLMYCANKKSANAAESAAKTADATLKSNERQFRMEQRPYIWAYAVAGTNNEVLPPIGGKIYIRVDFKNSGRTPAIHVVPTHSITIAAPANEARRQARAFVAEYPPIPGAVLTPEITGSAPTGYGPMLTDKILAEIKDGTWEVYVVGAVRYTDVFQPVIAPYETTYCVQFIPSGLPFGACDFFEDSIK